MSRLIHRAFAVGVLLGAWVGAPGPAQAQAAPQIEAWLYQPHAFVQTDGGPRPRLRLYAADGTLLSDVLATETAVRRVGASTWWPWIGRRRVACSGRVSASR